MLQMFFSSIGLLVKKHGVTGVAVVTGLSRESLYKTFNGNIQSKWNTIFKVTNAIGLHFVVA